MDLGEFQLCLKTSDIEKSIDFYSRLDFSVIEDSRAEGWAVLKHNNLILALYQGHIERNLINFRGGDIPVIVADAKEAGLSFTADALESPDGSTSAELIDPDGNRIFFNTFPFERERYLETGSVIDLSE